MIGLYTLIQAWFNLLDLGLSPMLARSFAQHINGKGDIKLNNLLRSTEIIITILSVLILAIVWLAFKYNYLTSNLTSSIEKRDIQYILILFMGLVILRLFESIYKSSLIGMQKHLSINVSVTVLIFLKTMNSIMVLHFFTNNPVYFFVIQLVFGALTTLTLLILTYNSMPQSMRSARFSLIEIQRVFKFSIGVLGISLLTVALTQTDKVILTKYLSLEQYGYYALSASVASVLHALIQPIVTTLSPKLAELQKNKDTNEFGRYFLLGSELISIVSCSVGGFILVFSYELIALWTANATIAAKTHNVCTLLVIGNIINGIMWMPHTAQIANGWTSLALRMNLCSIAVLIPLNLIFIPIYGAQASATIWIFLSTSQAVIGSKIMFATILKQERRTWVLTSVVMPLGVGIAIPTFAKYVIISSNTHLSVVLIQYLLILVITFTLLLLLSPTITRAINENRKK